MAFEIERKFLVRGDYMKDVHESVRILQGYLARTGRCSVRVRLRGESGFLTIKGPTDAAGVSRFEWEKEIGADDAESLMALAEPGRVEKIRHLAKNTDGVHTWEIDEFLGENQGLVVAEIELRTVDDDFDRPEWLGAEVTGDPRFYNSMLARRPFGTWNDDEKSLAIAGIAKIV